MEFIYASEKPAEKELLDFYNQMGWNDFLGLDLVGMEAFDCGKLLYDFRLFKWKIDWQCKNYFRWRHKRLSMRLGSIGAIP